METTNRGGGGSLGLKDKNMTRNVFRDHGPTFQGPPEHANVLPFYQMKQGDRLMTLAEIGTEEVSLDLTAYIGSLGKRDKKKRPPPIADIEVERQVPDHDILHLKRVVESGKHIVTEDFADDRKTKRIVDAILKVHDIITHPKNSKLYKVEAQESADYAENLLRVCEYSEDDIREIILGVKQISYIRNTPPETPEAKISFDADKIDQFGAIGFLRYYATGGQISRPFFHPDDALHKNRRRKLRQFEYTLDARLKRLPEILFMMFTRTGMRIADRRNDFEQNVIFSEIETELREYGEYEGRGWTTESGAMLIMRVLDQAGKNGKSFYEPNDTFGEKGRQLEPSKYPLDELIIASRNGMAKNAPQEIGDRRQKFLQDFLAELKLELAGK